MSEWGSFFVKCRWIYVLKNKFLGKEEDCSSQYESSTDHSLGYSTRKQQESSLGYYTSTEQESEYASEQSTTDEFFYINNRQYLSYFTELYYTSQFDQRI